MKTKKKLSCSTATHGEEQRSTSIRRIFARLFKALSLAVYAVVCCKLSCTSADVLQPIVRINAGGGTYVDTSGNTWRSDTYYENGGTMGEYKTSAVAIQKTSNPQLYQSQHYWRRIKPGPFLYQIPVPSNGKYIVQMHFAELDPGQAKVGQRTFDIVVQGLVVFPAFDVYQRTTAAFTALNVTAVAKVVTGHGRMVTIELRKIRFNPMISALAIFWNGKDPIPPWKFPPVVAPSLAPVKVVNASLGPVASPTAAGFQPVLINAGGSPYMDMVGNVWKGDAQTNYFSGGQVANIPLSIAGTLEDELYQTERNGAFTYEIPLPEGDYEIVLHFVELYTANTSPGSRVFDVLVEHSPTFVGVDISSIVGLAKALTLETATPVLDGALSLSFSGTVGGAQLSAIEINLVGDHLAHAVTTGPYAVVDAIGKGYAMVPVDGTPSHTHGPGLSIVQWLWYEGQKIVGTGETATLNLTVGEHYITLVVTDENNNKSSETTTVNVFPKGYPVLVSLTPTSGFVSGGNPVIISGYGFNFTADQIFVRIGKQILTGASQIVVRSETEIEVLSVPPSIAGIPVAVSVTTPISVSNTAVYKYVKGAPIDWTRGSLYNIFAPSAFAFGPDSKLYIGTTNGMIVKLTLSGSFTVVSEVMSNAIGSGRTILGMIFDPLSADQANPPVYVSHSKPFHGEPKSSFGEAINGKVSMVSGANLDKVTDVVTGLPVSDHDHAVNGLEFGDAGELYILVGGNTNGGIPGALSGSQIQKDNVLSSAVLVAYLSDPDFKGVLTYDAPDNGNLNPGSGVELFAAGLRNPFDIVLHSNLKLYATDNGPNLKYVRRRRRRRRRRTLA
jgi:Malectin domain/IPT/TIG domain